MKVQLLHGTTFSFKTKQDSNVQHDKKNKEYFTHPHMACIHLTHISHTHTFNSLPAADRELGFAHSICPAITAATARGTIRIALLLFNAHFHVFGVHDQALPEQIEGTLVLQIQKKHEQNVAKLI